MAEGDSAIELDRRDLGARDPSSGSSAERMGALFEAVLEQTRVPVVVVSCPDLVLRYHNRAALDVLGVADEPSYLGLTLDRLQERQTWRDFHPDGSAIPPSETPLARALRGESVRNEEMYALRKDGTRAWELVSATPVHDAQGVQSAAVLVFPDITSRKNAEAAARQAAADMTWLLKSMDHAFAAWEMVYAENGKLEDIRFGYFNEAYARVSGLRLDEVRGRTVREVWPATEQSWYDVYDEVARSGLPRSFEMYHEPTHGLYACNAYRPGESAGRVCVVFEEVSQRRKVEEERARLQEQLQQAVKIEAVGRLAGGVAHDFNNLLTVISAYVTLAKARLHAADPLRTYVDEIERAADRAASLTQQLLAFSRRQIVEPRVVSLNDLVLELRQMLVRLVGEDVRLETALAPDLGAARIDPGQFHQVLANLAVNARDAMPTGGRLTIETMNVEIGDEYCRTHAYVQPGPYVVLAVSDNGCGMDDEVKRRLFEPFFTTKPRGRGTGLGLAVTFGIVKQAGGSIEVYSEVGQGTTFRVYLPRVHATIEPVTEPDLVPDLPHGDETILLVEDEPSVREVAILLLEQLGYDVLVATDGSEGLRVAEAHHGPIALLMSDVVMPGINGRELAERLCAQHPETRVLFTSGYTEDVVVRHGVLESELSFIGKPYTLESLARKIRLVLDAQR